MYVGKTLFAQLLDFLPWTTFTRVVTHYGGDHRVRTLPCAEHFRILAFAQLTYRESLGDVEVCLPAQAAKRYHMGIRSPVSRSTLADASEHRDWRIYADFAQRLIAQARRLYAGEDLGLELSNTVYALDSTTIDLCLSLFPWAPFRRTKAAIKLHTLLDLRGSIPSFIHVFDDKLHDVARWTCSCPLPFTSWTVAIWISNGFLHSIRPAPSLSPEPSRVVVQMNQAASSYQAVLRHLAERREDANLDRHVGLRAGRHCQEEASLGRIALHFATDFLSDTVRENPFKQRVFEYGIQRQRPLVT